MNSVAVIVHDPGLERAQKVYREMLAWLEARGFDVISCDSRCPELPAEAADAQWAISLGGDGTFLSCARLLAANPVPILPVHLGTFGFITEVTQGEWVESLEKWIAGTLKEESRLALVVTVHRKGREITRIIGVNDAVVSAAGISKVLRLSLDLAGTTEAGRFRGDGVIVATPTGSTAYSMAAGGPIVHPAMRALLLTPICPFSLSWRPLVIPDEEGVGITVDEDQRAEVILTVDGQELCPLEPGDLVRVRGRPDGIRIIKSDRREFYEVVRSKLGWSGGPHA